MAQCHFDSPPPPPSFSSPTSPFSSSSSSASFTTASPGSSTTSEEDLHEDQRNLVLYEGYNSCDSEATYEDRHDNRYTVSQYRSENESESANGSITLEESESDISNSSGDRVWVTFGGNRCRSRNFGAFGMEPVDDCISSETDSDGGVKLVGADGEDDSGDGVLEYSCGCPHCEVFHGESYSGYETGLDAGSDIYPMNARSYNDISNASEDSVCADLYFKDFDGVYTPSTSYYDTESDSNSNSGVKLMEDYPGGINSPPCFGGSGFDVVCQSEISRSSSVLFWEELYAEIYGADSSRGSNDSTTSPPFKRHVDGSG